MEDSIGTTANFTVSSRFSPGLRSSAHLSVPSSVGFTLSVSGESSFTGEMVKELLALVEAGTIRVIDAFTPHLMARGSGTILTVSSGIAFLPFPLMPSYGASKAGVHAYTESLRAQLAGTGIEVAELVPPAVATAGQEKVNPAALPLDAYLDEVMELLATEPTPHEILVKGVLRHRWAECDGIYAELLERRSQSLNTLPNR